MSALVKRQLVLAITTVVGIAAVASARSETITFDADAGILIVRGRDSGGDARFEFLAEGDEKLQCVALDASGNPLAVENTWADLGYVRFDELDIRSVDRVVCRSRE